MVLRYARRSNGREKTKMKEETDVLEMIKNKVGDNSQSIKSKTL